MKLDKRKIEIAMARAQLSREDLSEKSNLPFTTIRNAIQRTGCRPITAGKIAKALGVDVTEIIED